MFRRKTRTAQGAQITWFLVETCQPFLTSFFTQPLQVFDDVLVGSPVRKKKPNISIYF